MAKATSEELVLITPQQAKLITETIETKLAVKNITDTAIQKYREEALVLKINGPEDKAGYELVYKKRQEGKKTRILAAEICKLGREPLQAEVELWIKKQTEITIAIKEAEAYLLGQEQTYEAAKQKIEDDKQAAIAERLKVRDKILVGLGARCNGVDYYLDEKMFPLSEVKSAGDEYFNDKIVAEFKEIFDAKEQIRIVNENAVREHQAQQEKERKEREEKEKKEREELEKQQKELRDQQAKLKADADKIERQKEAALKAKVKDRSEELEALGFTYSMHHEKYMFKGILSIDPEAVTLSEEDDWNKLIEETKPKVEEHLDALKKNEEQNQKRLNQEAIDKANREREEKELQEHLKKEALLLEAKESVRYKEIVKYLKAAPITQFDSGFYIKKIRIIKDFLADLK